VLKASFKGWALPAHVIRADGRNAGGSANGNAAISRRDARLSDLARRSANNTVARYLRKSGRVFSADWPGPDFPYSRSGFMSDFSDFIALASQTTLWRHG
jgi:hypothetical protein